MNHFLLPINFVNIALQIFCYIHVQLFCPEERGSRFPSTCQIIWNHISEDCSVADPSLLGCYATYAGKEFLMVWWNIVQN